MKSRELAQHVAQLNFTPRDVVRWLAPRELTRLGVKTLLGTVFADYADKREIQQGFESYVVTVPDELIGPGADFWFDYAADTGDGFDAAFTVASLMSQPTLRVDGADGALPRGGMLVLGGDEVYPTASAKEYEDRLIGPFRGALPHAVPQPLLIALPGNHDWYDGLTAFLRIFTHKRNIGGWRTVQSRSYFTVKLPHGWWLVGLDSQLGSYFDEPQVKYFEETLTANLSPGDGVILCSASPLWVKTVGDPDAFNSIEWFERKFVRSRLVAGTDLREPTGAEIRLYVTGDRHHYVRYAEILDDADAPAGTARQMVTCGLGGAYLGGTHHLASELKVLPEESRHARDGDGVSTFRQEGAMYPSASESRRWATRIAFPWCKQWLVTRNPGLLSLAAGVHLFLFSVLLLIFWQGVRAREEGRILDAYLNSDAEDLFGFAGRLLAVALVAAAISMAPVLRRRPPIVSVGVTMLVLSQLVVALACFVGFGLLPHARFLLLPDWLQLSAGAAIAALAGGILGSSIFGLYVALSHSDLARDWAFCGQSIDDGKGFLRIRLDSSGTLTIHPLLVDKVHRDFDISPAPVTTNSGRATRIPVPVGDLPRPRLIEPPFVVNRSVQQEPS